MQICISFRSHSDLVLDADHASDFPSDLAFQACISFYRCFRQRWRLNVFALFDSKCRCSHVLKGLPSERPIYESTLVGQTKLPWPSNPCAFFPKTHFRTHFSPLTKTHLISTLSGNKLFSEKGPSGNPTLTLQSSCFFFFFRFFRFPCFFFCAFLLSFPRIFKGLAERKILALFAGSSLFLAKKEAGIGGPRATVLS